jgi:hypothetical protein
MLEDMTTFGRRSGMARYRGRGYLGDVGWSKRSTRYGCDAVQRQDSSQAK